MALDKSERKRLAREIEALSIRIKVAAEDGHLTLAEIVVLISLAAKLATHLVKEARD